MILLEQKAHDISSNIDHNYPPQMALVFSCVPEYGYTEPGKHVVSKENADDNLEDIFHHIFPTNIGSPTKKANH